MSIRDTYLRVDTWIQSIEVISLKIRSHDRARRCSNHPRFPNHRNLCSDVNRTLPMTVIDFVIYALATFRVALMFSKEKSPCNIFNWIRERLCLQAKCLTQGVHCLWCWSVCIGGYFALYYWLGGPAWIVYALAFSCPAVLLDPAF